MWYKKSHWSLFYCNNNQKTKICFENNILYNNSLLCFFYLKNVYLDFEIKTVLNWKHAIRLNVSTMFTD